MASQMDERLSMIFERRSVREYSSDKLSETDLRSLLEAGMAAPSASNSKPWHFAVTTDPLLLERLAGAHAYGKMRSGEYLDTPRKNRSQGPSMTRVGYTITPGDPLIKKH